MQITGILGAATLSLKIISCSPQAVTASHSLKPFSDIKRTSILSSAETNKLDSLDINFQLRGHCYAFSSPANAKPSNGEAHSNNIAQPVDESFSLKGLYLSINERGLVKIGDRYLGHKLYLVNTGDTAVSFDAQDSRLYIIAEALNEKGHWVPITYLPSSWCGNSYHKIVLDKKEYWSFDIPVFKGTMKTRLRYSLIDDLKHQLISNEIMAYINPGQLNSNNKEGHSPSDIMDPYID